MVIYSRDIKPLQNTSQVISHNKMSNNNMHSFISLNSRQTNNSCMGTTVMSRQTIFIKIKAKNQNVHTLITMIGNYVHPAL
jgi:hypothetical protein